MNTRRLFVVLCIGLLLFLFLPPSFPGRAAPVSPDHYPDYEERTQLPRLASQQFQAASLSDLAAVSDLADWSKLVFQSYRDGNWEIYLASPGGANQQRLTNNAAADIHPRLNRGGTRVAFASKRSGSYEIYVVNVNGTGLTRLTFTGTDNVNPAWSPAGDRIAFQSYRDGQAEIYVMNADGSNQKRITANAVYDGEPAWSPDGTRIAFVSGRSGANRIWLMQADGTGSKQLSDSAYSENPVWSPDGRRIAFDTDYDGDGWQEIVVMLVDAEPWMEPTIFDLNRTNTDAWVGSWSPDGRYIAFTQISFIYYYGNWYWTEAYVRAWSVSDGQISALTPQDTEWSPDWQTLDVQCPVPILGISAESPSPIPVNYGAQDAGGSGVRSYDVQYRENTTAVWSDLLKEEPYMTPVYLNDVVGGQVFYFRMRARDNAYNVSAWTAEKVTTVEAYPPQSQVDSLPPYLRFTDEGFPVTWSVFDPGGSDIVSLEVQYRRDDQPWRDWLSNVSPPVTFYGETGHTYAFRTRAVDRAQNAELWPEGDGDTQTTLYTWGITGKVTDNAGAPVSGAVITTTPSALMQFYSVPTGDYGAYVAQNTDWYTLTMGKPGYGAVPATAFPLEPDAELDMVLPPVDNVVQDWGFESGDLSSGYWQSDSLTESVGVGSMSAIPGPPKITTEVFHTGQYAVEMGSGVTQVMSDLMPISYPQDVYITEPCMVQSPNGILYAMWWGIRSIDNQSMFYFVSRDLQGVWSTPEIGLSLSQAIGPFKCAIGFDDVIHGALSVDEGIFYIRRDLSGTWSEPWNIANSAYAAEVMDIAVDASGRVHVAWLDQVTPGIGAYTFYYAQRDLNGNWSAPYKVSADFDAVYGAQMLLDVKGVVHFLWSENDFWYRYLDEYGQWSQISVLADFATHFETTIGADGTIHVKWQDYEGGTGTWYTYYTRKLPNASFSTPIRTPGYKSGFFADFQGDAYIFWLDGDNLYYFSTDGQQFTPSQFLGQVDLLQGAVDVNGVLHLIWRSDDALYYIYWHPVFGQVGPRLIAHGFDNCYFSPKMIAEDIQQLHLLCLVDYQLFYAGPSLATSSEDHIVSQFVTLPSTMTHPILSYFSHLGGIQVNSGSDFIIRVEDAVGTTTLFTDTQNTATWQHHWLDMYPWQGQSITLTFTLHQAADKPYAYAYLDEVSLGSARPDVWIAGTDASGLPGELIVYTIDYGNQGGGTARSVRITNTLPLDITFVDASVLPAITTPSLVWDVGTLAPQSAASQIAVTVTLAPTVTPFTTLAHTLEIAPQDMGMSGTLMLDPGLVELEIANNVTTAGIFVGKHVFLPLILKKF